MAQQIRSSVLRLSPLIGHNYCDLTVLAHSITKHSFCVVRNLGACVMQMSYCVSTHAMVLSFSWCSVLRPFPATKCFHLMVVGSYWPIPGHVHHIKKSPVPVGGAGIKCRCLHIPHGPCRSYQHKTIHWVFAFQAHAHT